MSHMTPSQLEDLGIGLNEGILWEEALHAALMPVTPQCSMGSLSESEWGEAPLIKIENDPLTGG